MLLPCSDLPRPQPNNHFSSIMTCGIEVVKQQLIDEWFLSKQGLDGWTEMISMLAKRFQKHVASVFYSHSVLDHQKMRTL